MNTIYGVNVFESPFAVRVEHFIQKLPMRKRRKGYRVTKRQVPCMFKMAHGVVVHPDLMPALRAASIEANAGVFK